MQPTLADSDRRTADPGPDLLRVTNPASGELLGVVAIATPNAVRAAIELAQTGRSLMRSMPAHERSAVLARVAGKIEADRERLARLLAAENGKPLRETREEIDAAARIFRGFGEEAKRLFGRSFPMDAVPGLERHVALTVRQPIGVVAAIVPFNYPVELYAHKAAAALAAGNAVIGKPPSECPLTLLEIAALIREAGIPEAGHQLLVGPGRIIGPILASSPGVDLLTLTGSVEVGVELSRIASAQLKRVHAELGGNDASIVCADADLDLAARAIVLGRLSRGNGQICCSVKRVFAERPVAKALADRLTALAGQLRVGDQLDEATDVGPLISEAAAVGVVEAIEEAVRDGARLIVGGERRGAFVTPAVLADVPPSTRLFRDETFGPVLPIVPFDTVAEAVAMANDSPFGLQAAVFTRDIAQAFSIAERLEAGGVVINWSSALRSETLPFGGVKMSGHGREGIHDTLLSMTEEKVVLFYGVLGAADPEEIR